jgi:hypothetical protein
MAHRAWRREQSAEGRGQRAERIGHGAESKAQGAGGRGQGAWRIGQRAEGRAHGAWRRGTGVGSQGAGIGGQRGVTIKGLINRLEDFTEISYC